MPYIAFNPESYKGKSVGNGQCVVFVEEAAKTPITKFWQQGKKVAGNALNKGTAIATFSMGGYYGNNTNGTSHAAIYLWQNKDGIYVLDQWNHQGQRQPVHERLIHFRDRNWQGKLVDNADCYYVID